MMTRTAELLAAIASAAFIAGPAAAADYYAGKTIELVVGGDAGGGYDIYARAVARHLAGHIPGNPTIVVKNMPGAGSTRAGIYISTIAPKDGTSIGALMPGAIIGPLLDDKPNLQFDPTKVLYVGTADSGVRVCATYGSSKIKTFEDAQQQKTVLGASSAGGATRDYAYMHNHTAGTKFEVVSGYKGTVDVALAMERGEVDGMCGWDWSSVKSQKSDWVSEKKVNVLVQVSLEPLEELTERGVPHIWKFVPKEDDRKVAELVVSQQVFPALLYCSPANASGGARHPAHGVRRDHEGPGVPDRRREDENLDHAAGRRQGAGPDRAALFNAAGVRRARQGGDQAVRVVSSE